MTKVLDRTSEGISLFCGNAVDMQSYAKQSSKGLSVVRSIICSPGYNLGMNYGVDSEGNKISDNLSERQYINFINACFFTWAAISAPDCVLWMDLKPSQLTFETIAFVGKDNPWVLQNTFAWVFSATVPAPGKKGENKEHSFGHYATTKRSKTSVHSGFELMFQFHKRKHGPVDLNRVGNGNGVPYKDPRNLKRFDGSRTEEEKAAQPIQDNLRCRGNVWVIKHDTRNGNGAKNRKHPCPFPIGLASRCISMQTNLKKYDPFSGEPQDCVIDPFAGSGTTMIAAMRNGVAGHGIDLSPDSLAGAADRIAEEAARLNTETGAR